MNVVDFLQKKDVGFELLPHRDTYDAQRMAQALHVSGRHVAKTVLVRADRGFTYVVVVLPATSQVDLSKTSTALGGAEVALASEIEISREFPDCEIGAVPPFGSQYGLKTVLDEKLLDEEEIVFEGNTHHEAVRMNLADFRRVEEPMVASVSH